MEKDELKWLDSIPKLSDERITLYIQGLTIALERVKKDTVVAMLNEKLGCLEAEARKRNLSV